MIPIYQTRSLASLQASAPTGAALRVEAGIVERVS